MASDSEGSEVDFVVNDDDFEENFEEYAKKNLGELKELCKNRGIAATGRKQELIDRLQEYDETGPIWNEIERPVHLPTFRKKSGPVVTLSEDAVASNFFELLFTAELVDIVVNETNKYAEQKINHPFTAASTKRRWEPTTAEEIRAFFGCFTYMGLCSLGDIEDYWSEDLGQERITSVFSRNRFTDILRYLHCNDNDTALPRDHANHDKLHKVRPVMNLLQKSFKKYWVPHQECSIDEGMIPFTGRSSLKQYMKDKPNKWGFKMWKLVDSKSSYLYAFDIYTGKGAEREVGLGEHVVQQLAKELQPGQPWMLYFDNFFSSVDLIDELYKEGMFATATIRPNRAGLPKEIKEAKLQPGELIWRMKDPQIVVTKWKDTKDVILISSMSRPIPNETDFVKKSQKGTAEKLIRQCPPCIKPYRQNMGGVDTNDQMMSYQNFSRKSYRWWMPIFFDLLKQAIVNAWILQQFQPNAKKRGQKDFRIELSKNLIGKFSSRKRSVGQQPNATKRFDGIQHFVEKTDKRGYCKNECGSKVMYKCTKCDIFLCIDCFRPYHT